MAIERRKSKRKGMRYLVRVYDRLGRRSPGVVFDRLIDAQRYERQQKERLAQNDHIEALCNTKYSFRDYWCLWLSECRSHISEGWKSDQERMGADYVLPILGKANLNDIRPQHVALVLSEMRKSNKSEQTVMHVYNTLHKCFDDAIHHFELISSNPVKKRYKPKLRKKERVFLNPSQSIQLLNYVRCKPLGSAIWLSLLAGLRPSEVQALKYDCVDFDKRQINIQAAYKRKVKRIEAYPKQSDWGRASMPPDLVEYLLELLPSGFKKNQFVAPGIDGGMLSYHVFYKGLKRYCKHLDLPIVTPHGLRHSCTELMIDVGASAEDVRRQLNHSSLRSTRSYIHRTDERLARLTGSISVPRLVALK